MSIDKIESDVQNPVPLDYGQKLGDSSAVIGKNTITVDMFAALHLMAAR